MIDSNQPIYRRGRLQLPRDITEWAAEELAAWLSHLPLEDRVRAFRALPFSRGAIGYLAMAPADRAGLVSALNGDNRRRLTGLSSNESLAETFRHANAVTRAILLEVLPENRRTDIEARVSEPATPVPAQAAGERRLRWRAVLRRVVAGRRPRRGKSSA